MKEKTLKYLVYAAGIICTYVYASIMFEGLFNFSLKEKVVEEKEDTRYGEMYYMSMIRHFREEGIPPNGLRYRFSDRQPDIADADVYLFGDSFFDFTRPVSFPELLADSMKENVFYAREDYPLAYFNRSGYARDGRKLLIYESTERYVPLRFEHPHPPYAPVDNRSPFRKKIANLKNHVFERDLDSYFRLFLQRNYVTTSLFSLAATLKFDAFGYISDITPLYSLDQDIPWLFYYDQLNDEPSSYYYHHSEEELENICNNIEDLSRKLKELYNLDMIFMVIPTKYTVYHTILNNDPYNEFIPRLNKKLQERGIPIIPLYDDYMHSDSLLYYGTDSHWTPEGLRIAVGNALNTIRNLE